MKKKKLNGQNTAGKGMIEGFDLEVLFNQCLEQPETKTGQLPLDAVIAVVQKTKTHRATSIATALGLNVTFLKASIVLLTGMTLTDLILRWRLYQAKHLLQTTDQTYTAIARQCGYQNSISMILAFEKTFGKTPVDVRNGTTRRRWKQNTI